MNIGPKNIAQKNINHVVIPDEKVKVHDIERNPQIMNFKLNGIWEMETQMPQVTHDKIKSLSFIGLVQTSICWSPKTTEEETKAKVKILALAIKLFFANIQQMIKLERKQHAYLTYI